MCQGKEKNTRALVNAMRRYPCIDIIAHPSFTPLPVDIDAITDVALETGTALEINNARLGLGRVEDDCMSRMLELAREKGTQLAVNSDGHVFSEMGVFDNSIALLEKFGMDGLTIVNRTLESTCAFLGLEE